MKGKQESKIIELVCTNPWYNLAFNEYLLRETGEEEISLLLWQNKKSVVVGRNQNLRRVCRLQQVEAEGGKLARRLSGGGAVYQDQGCLNFAFLGDKQRFKLEHQLRVVLRAVQSLGLKAGFSGNRDLEAGGENFLFNTFYHREQVSLHHGTIMVDSELANRERYLKSTEDEAVKERYVNLSQLEPDLVIEDLKDKLRESFVEIYGEPGTAKRLDPRKQEKLKPLYDRYSSREWYLRVLPEFDVSYQTRFDWGRVELGLILDGDRIEMAVIYSDAVEADLIEKMAAVIEGAPFSLEAVIKRLDLLIGGGPDKKIVNDLKIWLKSKI
ncbi:MAG: lipoate--protein ligase [Bacillota bacterium]